MPCVPSAGAKKQGIGAAVLVRQRPWTASAATAEDEGASPLADTKDVVIEKFAELFAQKQKEHQLPGLANPTSEAKKDKKEKQKKRRRRRTQQQQQQQQRTVLALKVTIHGAAATGQRLHLLRGRLELGQ